MQRSFRDYFILTLKGMAMGAADVVPGVSGGTIAFISGIYEELISSINKVNLSALNTAKNFGLKAAWIQINGNFLLALFLGIGISVLSLAKVLKWLLENQPILLWSFFFGLVIASILLVGRQIKQWNIKSIIALLLGMFVAYYITTIPPLGTSTSSWFLLIAGALAICAMILPGISGAFILVLLGAYKPVLEAITNRDFKTIFLVGIGAIIGLLTFARILKWLFTNYKNSTLALLTGFILGSLNKIWPWKEILTTRIDSHGKTVPILEKSISPMHYSELYNTDAQVLFAILLMCIGFLTIFILEKIAAKKA